MKRVIVIEWKGGVFNEMSIIDKPTDSKTVFELVDSGVTEYAAKYEVPIEKIEVNIFMQYSKN